MRSRGPIRLACTTVAPLHQILDFDVVQNARRVLKNIVFKEQEPFFMAVGLFKPHTPYHAHLKYWNRFFLFGPDDAERPTGPGPRSSYTYKKIFDTKPGGVQLSWGINPWEDKDKNFRRVIRTGYLASLAQTDDFIGHLLLQLETLKLRDSTLIVLVGDHGFNLGENNMIGKHTNFELAARVPTIFHIPWLSSSSSQKMKPGATLLKPLSPFVSGKGLPLADLVIGRDRHMTDFFELVDLYPTIASLMGVPLGNYSCDGKDQSKPIISTALRGHTNGLSKVRTEAFNQVNRCASSDCSQTPLSTYNAAGYSVRTDKWRFTVFVLAPQGVPNWKQELSRELYSHANDPDTILKYENGTSYNMEYENLAQSHPKVCAELLRLIKARYRDQTTHF